MSYQKCPMCDGAGSVGVGFPVGEPCRVCGGRGIINEQTGKPPADDTYFTDTTAGTERKP